MLNPDALRRQLTPEEEAVIKATVAPLQAAVFELIRDFGEQCEPVGHHLAVLAMVEVVGIQMRAITNLRPELRGLFLGYIDDLKLLIAAPNVPC